VFLYYARAIDSTMLVALSDLASEQSAPTQKTMQDLQWFLDYAATRPEATVRYHRSAMILAISSDGSYLSAKRSRSRVGGYFYLSDEPSYDPTSAPPPINGSILVIANILKNVVSSTAEAEIAGCFTNAQEGCAVRNTLDDMGWKQPTTQLTTDNSCAEGFANRTMKQKKTKAMDMRYYWVLDRCDQKQYFILWRKGSTNIADYFSKHHPPDHHISIRSKFLHV